MPRYFLTAMLLGIVSVCALILGLRWRMLEQLEGRPGSIIAEQAQAAARSMPLPLHSDPPESKAAGDVTTGGAENSISASAADPPAATPPAPLLPAGPQRVNINTASATELDTLPGIGPVLAERIVKHRRRHGPFASVAGLEAVEGIGPKKLAALKDLAYVEPAQ